jgi:hypothetical protein
MRRERILGAFVLGATLVGLAEVGCSKGEEEVEGSRNQVNAGGDTSKVLKSVLLLEGGCVATKVGDKHLLVSARCVSTEGTTYEAGKVLSFEAASGTTSDTANDEEGLETEQTKTDAGDAGKDAAGPSDAGADAATPKAGARTLTIDSIKIPMSFVSRCENDACAIGKIGASDAPDVAVIVLKDALETVPTLPVDLDAVGTGDPILAVGSGCAKITDLREDSNLRTTKTKAAPPKAVNHPGSAYKTEPNIVGQLGQGYIVAPGIGWRDKETKVCKEDFGTPLFRSSAADRPRSSASSRTRRCTRTSRPPSRSITRASTARRASASARG